MTQRWSAIQVNPEGDVWAVGSGDELQGIHLLVMPQPNVMTALRAAWLAEQLNKLDKNGDGHDPK